MPVNMSHLPGHCACVLPGAPMGVVLSFMLCMQFETSAVSLESLLFLVLEVFQRPLACKTPRTPVLVL